MNKQKCIGIRLDPQENSKYFWLEGLIPSNGVTLTRVNDNTNNLN